MFFPNWLIRIADKSEFLFQKYKKLANNFFNSYVNLVDESQFSYIEQNLKHIISKAMEWSPKYAEWYVYQSMKDPNNPDKKPPWQHRLSEAKDYLKSNEGKIQSLKTPAEEVIEASEEWHREIAAKGEGLQYKTNNVILNLSDGWTVVDVADKNDLKVEGYLMGHCVGDYCQDVYSGATKILSLRDHKNLPHVTIEMSTQKQVSWFPHPDKILGYTIHQIKGKGNSPQMSPPAMKYLPKIKEALIGLTEKMPYTIERDGVEDLLGWFQKEDDVSQLLSVLEKINDQKDIQHKHNLFNTYNTARYGPNDDDLYNFAKELADYDSFNFMEYVQPYTEYLLNKGGEIKYEIIDKIESLRRFFVGDEDEDTDSEGYMEEETFNEMIRDLDHGTFDYGLFQGSSVEDYITNVIFEYWKQGYDVAEFLLDYDEKSIKDAYIQNMHEKSESQYDFGKLYNEWSKYYSNQRKTQLRQNHNNRLQTVMNTFNIKIPQVDVSDYDIMMQRLGPAYLRPEEPDNVWANKIQSTISQFLPV